MPTSIGTLSKSRNQVLHLVLHHFNPPYQGKFTKTNISLGRSTNDCSKDKGMQTQVCKNGSQFHYNFFSLTSSPPSMLPSSSIYSPSMRSEGLNQSIYRHMEGQGSIYSLLDEEKLQIFIFWAYFLMYVGHSEERCMYMRVVSWWPTYTHKHDF